jgi:hypothetical protein
MYELIMSNSFLTSSKCVQFAVFCVVHPCPQLKCSGEGMQDVIGGMARNVVSAPSGGKEGRALSGPVGTVQWNCEKLVCHNEWHARWSLFAMGGGLALSWTVRILIFFLY